MTETELTALMYPPATPTAREKTEADVVRAWCCTQIRVPFTRFIWFNAGAPRSPRCIGAVTNRLAATTDVKLAVGLDEDELAETVGHEIFHAAQIYFERRGPGRYTEEMHREAEAFGKQARAWWKALQGRW